MFCFVFLSRFDGRPFAGPAKRALCLYELLSLVVEIDWIPHLLSLLSAVVVVVICVWERKEEEERDTHTLGRFELVLIWMKRRELYELIIFAGSLEIVCEGFIPSFCVFHHCCRASTHTHSAAAGS